MDADQSGQSNDADPSTALESSEGSGSRGKIDRQITKLRLPRVGDIPFEPKLRTNRRGELEMERREVEHGTMKGKFGVVDTIGRIWIRDKAHADVPDHWDVQIDLGKSYIRVDDSGNEI